VTDEQAPALTTEQAAATVGVSVSQFRRLCRRHGLTASGLQRRGKVRANLYSQTQVAWLVAQRLQGTDGHADADADARSDTHAQARTSLQVATPGDVLQEALARVEDYARRFGQVEGERDAERRLREQAETRERALLEAQGQLRAQLAAATQRRHWWQRRR
jgi:hypothetical protein